MAKTGYLIVVYQDINPSSPTYNQTREDRTQDEAICPSSASAHWIMDTRYCELTERGMLTGYEITVYRDVEPLSSTYNQTREERELNLTDCEADEATPNWQNIGEPFCRQIVYTPGGLMGNDGYMVQQQQDMNEYSETADEIREIETLDLTNCPLPNTEPVWQTISESCHTVMYNGQLVYDGTKDIVRVNTNQYSPSWNDNVPETTNVEDEINCPSTMPIQYRWVTVSGEYMCVDYDKYTKEKKQESDDGGQTWTDVVPLLTRIGTLVEANSEYCGYVPPTPTTQYRWVTIEDAFMCAYENEYSVEKKQQSTDGGQTWTDVSPTETRAGELIEINAKVCMYNPPETIIYRWVTVEGQYYCAGYNKYTWEKRQQSTDGGITWTDVGSSDPNVGPYYTRVGVLVERNSQYCGYVPTTEYRWVTVEGEYMCVDYDKYTKEKKQESNDGGTTWSDVVPLLTRVGTLVEANSEYCGYVPPTPIQYRWVTVSGEYMCVGYDKYTKEKKQQSTDGGTTWSDVTPTETRAGELVEANSEYCGYVPPTPTPTNKYLTFVALEDGTFHFTKTGISYSLDEGQTWTSLAARTSTPTVTTGNKIMWKGNLTPTSSDGIGTFSSTGNFDAEGNPMSLLFGDNFVGQTDLTGYSYAFYQLFKNNFKLINANNLSLPATTLADSCYKYMFEGCTSLTTAPALPATTLAERCYDSMFCLCQSLTTAPALPATTLGNWCYYDMFEQCTSLTTAPALPATTLAVACYSMMFYQCGNLRTAPQLPATTLAYACYSSMFNSCTSLTTAPVLPATTLETYCYYYMFDQCTSLNYIKCLATDISASDCTYNWVRNVAATGTFVKASSMSDWTTGVNGIPSGWTVLNE